MGTSQSSGGAPSGVPMVPPWVPDPPADEPPADNEGEDDPGQQQAAPVGPVPIAPLARFRIARRAIGNFARTGEGREMQRALGNYVHSGYGGSRTTVRRFGGTASTAEALYGVLSAMAVGQAAAQGSPLDPALLAGRSAQEVMDAVVEAVRPIDGTQDAEAGRAAIRNALSELLTRFPDADLINLTEDQRSFAIERYVASDVYFRFDLDIGKTILEKAPTAVAALERLKEVCDYIKETVSAAFRRLRDAGHAITSGRVGQIVRGALSETFQVFEGYAE